MREYFVHQSAYIEENVKIGQATRIWINAQVRTGADIGNNCNIGKDTFIDAGVKIGNCVKIQNGVSVYHGVTIEDDVFIGPNATFTNDMYPRAFNDEWKVSTTLIKKGASIGANATIVCGVTLGAYCMVGAGSVVSKDVPEHALVVGNPAKVIGYVCDCGNPLNDYQKCANCGKNYIR